MAYIKYNDDPLAKRVSDAFANLCSTLPTKRALRLVDKCFSIFNGSQKETNFCELSNFAYPVDSSLAIDFEVCAGETLSVYDNDTDSVIPYQPSGNPSGNPSNYPFGNGLEFIEASGSDPSGTPYYYVIQNDRNYARGCMLYIKYPMKDKNGDDILPADYECQLKITNRNLDEFTMPLHEFFAHFANPETRGADSLINKLEIYNPNADFSIKVTGVVIYAKSNTDPNDCAC
jgi:hypothetical protein